MITHFHRAEGSAAAEGKGENFLKNLSGNKPIKFAVLQLQHESSQSTI